jgi:hypothetical protein
MYIRDKSRIYTGLKHLVAFGTLRVQVLSLELRAAPRDPYFMSQTMMKCEKTKTVAMGLRMTVRDKAAIEERARDNVPMSTRSTSCASVDELKAMHARLRGIAAHHYNSRSAYECCFFSIPSTPASVSRPQV